MAYTHDELDFIDAALIGIATGLYGDPNIEAVNEEDVGRSALSLLAERRKIRGPVKVLDEEGAKRLERLNVLYAAACQWAGFVGPDPLGEQVPIVLQRLEEQRAESRDRSSRLVNLGLAKDASDRRVRELEAALAMQEAEQPRTKAHDARLVERVALAWFDAAGPDANPATRAAAKTYIDPATRVLNEIAKTPVEMPTVDDVVRAYDPSHVAGTYLSSEAQRDAKAIVEMVRVRLAPILAAQKAVIDAAHCRIAELEKSLADDVAKFHAQTQEAMAQRDQALDQRDEAQKRIAELEMHVDTIRQRAFLAKDQDIATEVSRLYGFEDYCRREMNEQGIAALGDDGKKMDQMRRVMLYVRFQNERVAELKKQQVISEGRTRDAEAELQRINVMARSALDGNVMPVGSDWIAAQANVEALIARLADQAPKVKEWSDAIDALCEVWPKDLHYAKANPTHAEWIRDLVAVKERIAAARVMEVLQEVRGSINGGVVESVVREQCLMLIDEAIAMHGGQPQTTIMTDNCTICGCINESAFVVPCIENGKHNFEVETTRCKGCGKPIQLPPTIHVCSTVGEP